MVFEILYRLPTLVIAENMLYGHNLCFLLQNYETNSKYLPKI